MGGAGGVEEGSGEEGKVREGGMGGGEGEGRRRGR